VLTGYLELIVITYLPLLQAYVCMHACMHACMHNVTPACQHLR
jgi:hypothetical protein